MDELKNKNKRLPSYYIGKNVIDFDGWYIEKVLGMSFVPEEDSYLTTSNDNQMMFFEFDLDSVSDEEINQLFDFVMDDFEDPTT